MQEGAAVPATAAIGGPDGTALAQALGLVPDDASGLEEQPEAAEEVAPAVKADQGLVMRLLAHATNASVAKSRKYTGVTVKDTRGGRLPGLQGLVMPGMSCKLSPSLR